MVLWSRGLLTISAATAPSIQHGFSTHTISEVRSNLLQIANRSWELGVAAEALTELSWSSLSVFDKRAFPPPAHLNATFNASDVLSIAHAVVSTKPATSLALIPAQGSAADPASVGVAVLVANWTRQVKPDQTYAKAASDQLEYLLDYVPRSDEGAISHRANELQLWADFVYMVPPFIAYFGALQGGKDGYDLLQLAYDQCRLYRSALRDTSGLWQHIVGGSFQDNSHWATANGWAAAGMLRVLQALNHSSQAVQFSEQQKNITHWIQEITSASWAHQESNGGLFNVIDDETSFIDTAATALLASVTYRMATFTRNMTLIPAANKALKYVESNVDEFGWLQNTVDPITFHDPLPHDGHSPEGQAFVLLLHAAWDAFNETVHKSTSI